MLQSSISAWLNKPQTTKQPPSYHPPPLRQTHKPFSIPPATIPPQKPTAPPPSQHPPAPTTVTNPAIPPSKPSLSPLPANVTLEPITPTTLPSFRRLNVLLLPIPYQPKFYNEILSDPITSSISLVAIWHDTPPHPANTSLTPAISNRHNDAPPATSTPSHGRVVAGIRCRLIPSSTTSNAQPTLYISTLATLSPFRCLSLASHLLSAVIRASIREHDIGAVEAHVWEQNSEALEWYTGTATETLAMIQDAGARTVGKDEGSGEQSQGKRNGKGKGRGFRIIGREENYYRRLKPSGAYILRRDIGVADRLAAQRGEMEKG